MIDWVIWGLRGIGWGVVFFALFTISSWWLFSRSPVLDFGDIKADCNFIEAASPPQVHLCDITWIRLCKSETQQRFTGSDGIERITVHPIKMADQPGVIKAKARTLEMPAHLPKGPYHVKMFALSECSFLDKMTPITAKMPELDSVNP